MTQAEAALAAEVDAPARPRRSALLLIVILGSLMATGPLASDLYLPAFPQIAADLGAREAQIQLTLTAIMIGMGVGQLVIGPLSDAWGRRRPLLVGAALFTITSVACMLVPSAEWFIGVRFLQGLAGAAGLVVARAVVRDLYEGDAAARLFSRLMLVVGLAPILGPILGGQLLRVGPWQLGFAVLAAVSAFSGLVIFFFLPESLPAADRRPLTPRELTGTVGRLLRDARFMSPALTMGFSFAMMFTYIASFSLVSQNEFGASPQQFSAMFAINTIGLVAGTQVNGALIGRMQTPRRLLAGLTGALLALVALAVLGVSGAASLTSLTCVFFAMMFSVGFVLPNATTLAINSQQPAVAGTASALLGSLQFALGGGLSALAGLTPSGDASLASMTVVMSTTGVIATVIFLLLWRRSAQP